MSGPRVAAALALAGALTACSSPYEGEICAAVVSYSEPVFTIDSAQGPNGDEVGALLLTDVRLDGRRVTAEWRSYAEMDHQPYRPGWSTSSSNLYFGLKAGRAGGLVCRVPCGFGSEGGVLTFDASTRTGLHATSRIDVTYGGSHGCGPTLDDGTHVDLDLQAVGKYRFN